MRVTVSHNKGRQGAKKIVDDSAAELFKGAPGTGIQIVDYHREWKGDTMFFSFTGKMGFFSTPLKGSVQVTEKDVTIDVDLPGILEKFMPEEKVRAGIETKVRGLLT